MVKELKRGTPSTRDQKARENIAKKTPKSIVIYGAPIHGSTGNSKLILNMAKAFKSGGHKVFTIGLDYNGPQLWYDGIPVMPSFFCERCGNSNKGSTESIKKIAETLNLLSSAAGKPIDYFICVGDPYQMQQMGIGNLGMSHTKTIMYATIDSEGTFCNELENYNEKEDYIIKCDKVISTAIFAQEQLKYWLNMDTELIHEAINLKNYEPIHKEKKIELRKKYSLKENDFVIYNSGRNIMRKRLFMLIDGCAKFLCEHENAYMLLNCPSHGKYPDTLNPVDFIKRVMKKKYGRDLIEEAKIILIEREGLGSNKIGEKDNANLYQIADVYATATGGEGFGLCCHPETNIISASGTRPITSISKDEYVFTHKGRLGKVTNVMERHINEELICLKPEKFRQELKVTKEHPILVSDCEGKPYFKEARLLKKGDILMYPKPNFKYYDKKWIIPNEYIRRLISINKRVHLFEKTYDKYTDRTLNWVHPNSKGLPDKLDINDFLELSGYWLAEGCVSKGQVLFCLNGKKDKDLKIKKFLKKISKKWKVSLSIKENTRNRCTWILNSSVLGRLLMNIFSCLSHNKKIPYWIFHQDDNRIKILLMALWEGDGCTYKRKGRNGYEHSYTTVSKHLANNIRLMLLKVGLVPSVQYHKGRNSYSLKITNQIKSFEKTLNSGDCKRYYRLKLKDLRTEMYNGKVYNLEVEGDKSYLCESVAVHNCPVESMACGVPAIIPDNSTGAETIGAIKDEDKLTESGFRFSKGGLLMNAPYEVYVDWGLLQRWTPSNLVYNTLEFLYKDPELVKRLGESARKHVEELFNIELFNKKWLKVIETTVKKKVEEKQDFKELKLEEKNDEKVKNNE